MSESSIPFGRPVQTVRPATSEIITAPTALEEAEPFFNKNEQEDATQTEADSPGSGRGGDNTLGRPIQKVRENVVSDVSLAKMEQIAESTFAAEEADIYAKPPELPLHWLSGLWLAGLLLIGLLGWLVFAQIVSTLQILMQWPWWLQLPAWGLVAFFTLIVIYPLARLFLAYRRLRPVRQIRLTIVRTTSPTPEQWQAARHTLTSYLQNYELDNLAKQLNQLGVSESTLSALQTSKQRLLENDLESSNIWLQIFERDFLTPLDMAAKARIQYYAKGLALKTALSPNPLIDIAMVLHSGLSLLRDTCTLHQVRTGRLGMWYLLGLVILQSYVAAQAEKHLDSAEQLLEGLFTESALGATGAKLAGMAGARAGKAALNFFFLRRIGNSMVTRLRPFTDCTAK